MNKILSCLFLLISSFHHLCAQVLPSEGVGLNYRVIGFSFSGTKDVKSYKLEIAKGNYNSEDSFKKNIILNKTTDENRVLAEVPYFGQEYTWRTICIGPHDAGKKSPLYHFSTRIMKAVDTSRSRLRVLKSATAYKDAYVFLDDTKALYNMQGKPVWFLPPIDEKQDQYFRVRDLKLSPWGTITFIGNDEAYEVNYNGDILWKAPVRQDISPQKREIYHHEFTRLKNGLYMVLGYQDVLLNDSLPLIAPAFNYGNSSVYTLVDFIPVDSPQRKVAFGNILIYDQKGSVAWCWRSLKYFLESDLYYFYYNDKMHTRSRLGLHDNSVFFDENANEIYLSFKGVNRVIKIKYPEGNVLNEYGEKFKPDVIPVMKHDLFCGQHSCKTSQDGDLYLFDNSTCDSTLLPQIVKFEQPRTDADTLKKVWSYQCTVEGDHPGRFFTGGNVIELPDGSFFASMSNKYSKIFIVSKDKEILWSALPEVWNVNENKWEIPDIYRASIITGHKEMEHLVWGEKF